jgi:hypothetical protein
MNPLSKTFFTTAILLTAFPSMLMAAQFQGKTTVFTSPAGVTEQCIALPAMPGATARQQDRTIEKEYCGVDLYNANTAHCPKIWSTSPGIILYDLSPGSFAGNVAKFEQTICGNGKGTKKLPVKKLAKFKSTMNGSETSGTFSTASLLYYHFSRYFDTMTDIPVAVWRSIDRKNHLERVTRNGVHLSGKSRMLHAGWLKMESAEENPSTYHPVDELFTPDASAIHGILLNSPGHRYKTTMNGTRVSGWGVGQNNDFQKTAPYLALRSEKPLTEAIQHGLQIAHKNKKMRHDLGKETTEAQMLFWMTELTEITLLDYIFSQQDRIGNIDYIPYWYWTENGIIHRLKAHNSQLPKELSDKNAILLKRSQLNDNDAGGRVSYINFTKKTTMLEKQRHYRTAIYKKLLRLNSDFSKQGPLYHYLQTTFALSEKQLMHIVNNTAEATAILQETCRAGKLRFDLDPTDYLLTNSTTRHNVNCENP